LPLFNHVPMNTTGNNPPISKEKNLLHAKFGAVLESVSDAIVMVDSHGHIGLANAHAAALFGYSPDELPGQPAEILLPERFRGAHAGQHGNYFSEPRQWSANVPLDLFGLRKDGSEFPTEINVSPVHTGEGTWAMSTIRDLTERKRLQSELKEKSAALETANQELQAFSYSISHDLRAPLRAMDGFAGMLKKSLGADISKETGHALQRIQDNAAKMSKLIDGLLDFSSLSWIAVTKKNVNPGEVAQTVFNELTASAPDRLVQFEIGKLPVCKYDPMLLRQVFINLLSNALKYTRDRNPAIIRVGCRQENSEHVYFVQDNGAGFDMEYSGKLFRVFQRLHSPSEFEGTGVGLAIVHRIIQRHGGRIWAEAQVDLGATFYFTLGDSTHGNST
jgi:PAS domain S-box-containing protein